MMRFTLFFFIVVFISCKQQTSSEVYFHHEFNKSPFPWTNPLFNDSDKKFSFAIVSDLYGGERPGVFQVAIEQINLLRPEFILSVGDLIEGGTEELNQLDNEWSAFNRKISAAQAPFFYVGGNHDLTNITMRNNWIERYGKRYYHFIYKDVLFLVLDSEDFAPDRMQEIYQARAIALEVLDGPDPSKAVETAYFKMEERRTGSIGDEQNSYFKKVLEENQHVKWTFLMMHKPLWKKEGKNGLSEIEDALSNRPYTIINGHLHAYSYESRNDNDYIMLGTTGGSQSDKNDMAFDHFTIVTMDKNGPSIANIRLDGLLDKTGSIPAGGDTLSFQASMGKNQ